MATTIELLRKTGLRRTGVREQILKVLSSAGRPLSHQDILKLQKGKRGLDRVTVYRTLETLQDVGLLHRIQGTDGVWRFCRHKQESAGKCGGNHIHFLCSRCNQMTCLQEQPLPWIAAPPGATIHSKQLVVHGHCAACVAKEKAHVKAR